MKGKIIITADPETSEAEKERLGAEYVSAIKVDCRIEGVGSLDKIALVKSLAQALHFKPVEYLMLSISAVDKGLMRTETTEVPRTKEMIRRIEEAETRGGGK